MSEDLHAFTDTGLALPWHEWDPSKVAADVADCIGAPSSAVVGLSCTVLPDGTVTAVIGITAVAVAE